MPRQRNIVLENESYRKASEDFYQTLTTLGYVADSCRCGQCCLEDFLHFMEQQGIDDINAIKNIHLADYQKYLYLRPNKTKGGTLNPKSIHHHFRNLNNFFSQQQEQGKIALNPFDGFIYRYPNVPDKERTVLTQQEIQILYQHTQNALEEAVLALAYGCGLRAGEVERLNIEDINFREHFLTVKQGKGNKRRIVPLAVKVAEQLENYLQERLQEQTDLKAFLLNFKKRRYREHNGNYLLRQLVSRSRNVELQQKEVSLHILRHSIATHLIEEGLALEKVRDFLGHYHLETTEIYTHISQKQINQLIRDE